MKIQTNHTLKYHRGDITYKAVGFIMALFCSTATLISYILPSYILQYLVVALCLIAEMVIILSTSHKKLRAERYTYIFVAALMLIISIVRGNWYFTTLVLYVSSICLCVIASLNLPVTRIIDVMLKILLVMDIIYGVFTILCYFSPSLYLNHVINLFPSYKARLIRYYNQGGNSGLTSHYSTNGMFLATGLTIAAAKLASEKSKRQLGLVIFFIVSLILTGKRAHLIFGIMAIFVLYYFSQSKKKAVNRWANFTVIILALLCLGVIALSAFPSLTGYFSRFQDGMASGDITNGRIELWKLALDAFKSNPIFGIGWRQFQLKYGIYFSSSSSANYDVHNVYLQLLCETGIIGFAVYMWWFIKVFRQTVRTYKRSIRNNVKTENKKKCFLLGFSLAYQSFFFLYCFTGNPLYDIYTFIPYFMSCALTIFYSYEQSNARKKIDSGKRVQKEENGLNG